VQDSSEVHMTKNPAISIKCIAASFHYQTANPRAADREHANCSGVTTTFETHGHVDKSCKCPCHQRDRDA